MTPARLKTRTTLNSKFAKIVKFSFKNPQLNPKQIGKKLQMPSDDISQVLHSAERQGYPVKGWEKRPTPAWKNPAVEKNVVLALSATLKPMKQIAREMKIPQGIVSQINARHSCRSPLITRALGQRTGIDWRKLPLANHFNRAEKNQVLMACTEEIGKMAWKKYKRELEKREDAQGKALVFALEALGHYNPEFGNPRLFALLAAQRAIREEVFENNTHDHGQRLILARAISQHFKSGRLIKTAK